MNIRLLDLNLLVALKALLEEKHVSRAALRIGLSQPAMSRALGKLRQILKDPLLVKGSGGLDLSARAIDLYQPLVNVLSEISQIISPPSSNPASMQGEIVIATRDNEMVSILPKFINCIMKDAPNLTLRIVPLIGDDLSLLEQNKVDFIIAGTDSKSTTLCRSTLYKEDFVCLLASHHPAVKHVITLKKFVEMKHCMVTLTGFGLGVVDTILAEKGLTRTIAIRVPHFLAASHIVANTDLIVTLPRKVGILFSKDKKINLIEPPIKIPSFPIYLYWHVRNQNNPVHKWLRKLIRDNNQ